MLNPTQQPLPSAGCRMLRDFDLVSTNPSNDALFDLFEVCIRSWMDCLYFLFLTLMQPYATQTIHSIIIIIFLLDERMEKLKP